MSRFSGRTIASLVMVAAIIFSLGTVAFAQNCVSLSTSLSQTGGAGSPVTYTATLINCSTAREGVTVTYKVTSSNGYTDSGSVKLALAAGETRTFSHTYTLAPGDYTVTATATSGTGNSISTSTSTTSLVVQ